VPGVLVPVPAPTARSKNGNFLILALAFDQQNAKISGDFLVFGIKFQGIAEAVLGLHQWSRGKLGDTPIIPALAGLFLRQRLAKQPQSFGKLLLFQQLQTLLIFDLSDN
jgi:hypothetical protein